MLVGLLFAGGLFLALKHRLTPAPVVQTVTVEKVVTKTLVRVKEVPVTNTVTETVKEVKLYKAQLLDADGKVLQEWEVTKCKFRVIGATLTDRNGKTFSVQGNIKIRPITDASDTPVAQLPETTNAINGAVVDAALVGAGN